MDTGQRIFCSFEDNTALKSGLKKCIKQPVNAFGNSQLLAHGLKASCQC